MKFLHLILGSLLLASCRSNTAIHTSSTKIPVIDVATLFSLGGFHPPLSKIDFRYDCYSSLNENDISAWHYSASQLLLGRQPNCVDYALGSFAAAQTFYGGCAPAYFYFEFDSKAGRHAANLFVTKKGELWYKDHMFNVCLPYREAVSMFEIRNESPHF